MTRKGFVIFVTFVVACSCVLGRAAAAQDAQPLRLSLEEARTRAVAASHRLAEARARASVAEAAVEIRQVADRPVVGASAGYTRTNHVTEFLFPGPTGGPRVLYPDVPDNYRTRVDLQWPIYTGGRTDALERAARADASAAEADVAAAQADLRLEVTRAFWAVVTAQATAVVVQQGLTRAQAHLSDVRQRFAAGLIPPNEVAAAQAQESRDRMLLIEAGNQRALASAELARLIGVDLLQPIDPVEALDVPAAPASPLAALVADARGLRNERRALEQRIAAADEQRLAAEAGRRPTVAVTGGFDYARPNPRIFPRARRWDDSWDAGIAVGWSLWDGGRTRAEARQAAGIAAASRQRLAEFDSVLALEVQQRLLDIDSGRAAIAAADDAVRAAGEARRVVAERYGSGVATQTDVLDAEVALLQAGLDRTRALAGVRLADARLARALGR
ncbi:MAG: TolC family protein [Acidobacteria bacterium]|nr:TolC family protein [Acidobacteriota bacterium]